MSDVFKFNMIEAPLRLSRYGDEIIALLTIDKQYLDFDFVGITFKTLIAQYYNQCLLGYKAGLFTI